MKNLVFISILSTTLAFCQTAAVIVYDWDFVIQFVRKHKMNPTKGTEEIVSLIKDKFEGQQEQIELIKFYKGAYDYKIVDKAILKNLVDSIRIFGISDEVRKFASESKNLIEYRHLSKKIRDFKFPDKEGNIIKLSSLNERIVIVELWATWCGPCIVEMRKIPELRKSNSNIEFYSISLDKSIKQMKKFIEKKKFDWPIVFGGDEEINKELWEYLNIVAIPKYYVVDRNGVVVKVADKLDGDYIQNLK